MVLSSLMISIPIPPLLLVLGTATKHPLLLVLVLALAGFVWSASRRMVPRRMEQHHRTETLMHACKIVPPPLDIIYGLGMALNFSIASISSLSPLRPDVLACHRLKYYRQARTGITMKEVACVRDCPLLCGCWLWPATAMSCDEPIHRLVSGEALPTIVHTTMLLILQAHAAAAFTAP